MWQTTPANRNASLGLNHTSSPLVGQNARGQNEGKEGHNPATPTGLSMVPSLGTWAEEQRMSNASSETNHLSNHATTPKRIRLTETGDVTVTPTESETTESSYKQPSSDQESANPFLSEPDQSTEITEPDEINIEEHEEARKQFQSKLGKRKGIMLASWNIRGKNDSAHKMANNS